MIVAFDSNQRSSVFLRQLYRDTGEILRPQPLAKLRALQPGGNLHHLYCRKVAVLTAARRVHRNHVLAPNGVFQPHLQCSIASPLHRIRRLSHPLVQCIDIKTTGSRRSEARLRILGKLLRSQQTIGPLQPTAETNLLRTQALLRNQPTLLRIHRVF